MQNKFKQGDRVFPVNKTTGAARGIDNSKVWRLARELGQPYIYVARVNNDNYHCTVVSSYEGARELFKEEDLIPFGKDNQDFAILMRPMQDLEEE